MSEQSKLSADGLEVGSVECNCPWNPDSHDKTCPVYLRDRLTDAQRLLSQRDARIAELEHEKEVLRDAIQGRHDMQAASVGGEREAFEAWAKSTPQGSQLPYVRDALPVTDPRYSEYVSEALRLGWEAWQARAALSPAGGGVEPDAARDVLAERNRQITAEGWTPEHDDEHGDGQMALAAGSYATYAHEAQHRGRGFWPPHWPWHRAWWKPCDPRRMLVKSGALILAEIERIDRANAKPQANSQEGSK